MTTQLITESTLYASAFEQLDAAADVHDLRKKAFDCFRDLGFPARRDEAWRYTDLRPITETEFARPGAGEAAVSAADLAPFALTGTDCHELVFVNGQYRRDLSSVGDPGHGVRVGTLAELVGGGVIPLPPALGRHAKFADDAFTALNTAFLEDAAIVLLPRDAVLDRPVHVLFVTSDDDGGPIITHPRVLVIAEPCSQATLIESHAGLGRGVSLSNAVSEIVLADGATLDHYKIQREGPEGLHVSAVWSYQGADSNLVSHTFSVGGRLARHNLDAVLDGSGAETTLNGLFMTRDTQHVDNHLRVHHLKPHCNSWEFYKGILDDRSSGVFTGRIYVEEDAQKTDAKQTNMNLLLSDDARVTTKPQLEIFADDVKCTHGATIGQIEPNELFYLQSRGIDAETARSLLIYAFANETISEIRVEELRRQFQRLLIERLPRGALLQDGL